MPHHCDVRKGDGEYNSRPGWRTHCAFCREWFFTDDQGPEGLVSVLRAKTQHEGDGSWPT